MDFPDSLIDKIAEWTSDFSFAYLKEAFVSSLLIIAARESQNKAESDDDNESFETVIKRQIETLRREMGDGSELVNSTRKLRLRGSMKVDDGTIYDCNNSFGY